jgi:hypothetical protein
MSKMTASEARDRGASVEHPSAEELAAYVSGSLAPPEASNLETHLSDCWPCRQEVTGARQLLRSRPGDRRWLVAPIAAAAVLALLLVRPDTVKLGEAPLRSDGGGGLDSVRTLAVVSPAEGDTASPDRPTFIWRAEAGAPLYRLTITDRTGRTLWRGDTSDTTLTPPPDLRLDNGSRFFWYVDALDVGGRSITTGTRSFHTAP